MDDKQQLLNRILEGRHLTPVFQPIVSLVDGKTINSKRSIQFSIRRHDADASSRYSEKSRHQK